MAIATLVTWLLTVSIGAYMLRTWIARGGPRMSRAGTGRLPPVVVYGHAGLATTGLVLWVSYLATGIAALAWSAAGLLTLVVGLGVAMVTVWTPYPTPAAGAAGPAGGAGIGGVFTPPAEDALARRLTDEVLARALTDDALAGRLTDEVLAQVPAHPSATGPRPKGYLAPLVPAGHGIAGLTTVLLAMVTAVSAR
ncbi:MAG TPA: hypothetical protein VGS62_03670 [Streptosporangiaceae bacterium]|nr:hypothetical protein [Streptosporangiaceae bacterium]